MPASPADTGVAAVAHAVVNPLLSDYTTCACAGTTAPAHCTLTYAPPEVVSAFFRSEHVVVDGSHDVWALGVMVYESLTGVQGVSPFKGKQARIRFARAFVTVTATLPPVLGFDLAQQSRTSSSGHRS
jgi:serine/threonine protein kinase